MKSLQYTPSYLGCDCFAGNCAVLKPSEISANTAALLEESLPKYLDNVREILYICAKSY